MFALTGHEGDGIGDLDLFTETNLIGLHTLFVMPRAHAQEGDAVAVLRVHVRLDLEYETGKFFFAGFDLAHFGLTRQRTRRDVDEVIEQLLHAEVIDGRTEKYRRQFASEEGLLIEFMARAFDQFDLITQLLCSIAEQVSKAWVIQAFDGLTGLNLATVGRAE